jgi:hypothetical protein
MNCQNFLCLFLEQILITLNFEMFPFFEYIDTIPLLILFVLNALRYKVLIYQYKCFYKSFALFHRTKLLRITITIPCNMLSIRGGAAIFSRLFFLLLYIGPHPLSPSLTSPPAPLLLERVAQYLIFD